MFEPTENIPNEFRHGIVTRKSRECSKTEPKKPESKQEQEARNRCEWKSVGEGGVKGESSIIKQEREKKERCKLEAGAFATRRACGVVAGAPLRPVYFNVTP